MVQFPPGFVVGWTILVLICSVSLFWMAVSPGVPHVEYTYLNIRFAGASSGLVGFSSRGRALAAGLLGRGCRCFGLCGAFSGFCRGRRALLEKYDVGLGPLLRQGVSEPGFCGDLVCRSRKTVGESNFSEQFRKLINRFKRIGYSLDIMRQTACLVVNPITVDGYASLFNCTTAVRASDSMTASS